jgi:hypothetical protein
VVDHRRSPVRGLSSRHFSTANVRVTRQPRAAKKDGLPGVSKVLGKWFGGHYLPRSRDREQRLLTAGRTRS